METEKVKRVNKKILLIGISVVLLIIVALGAWLFFRNTSELPSDPNRTATLNFMQDSVLVTPNSQITLNIVLETGPASVTEANVVLLYDPQAITVNSLLPSNPNLFGTSQEYQVTESRIDQENGQAFMQIKAVDTGSPPSTTRQGREQIAQLTLTTSQSFTGTTPIVFYQNESTPDVSTMVYKANYQGSILKNTTDINITSK